MTMRIFVVESFDDTTGTGLARDVQTNAVFSFDHTGLADSMDKVCFIGECVTASVVDGRITNLSATERPTELK